LLPKLKPAFPEPFEPEAEFALPPLILAFDADPEPELAEL